MKILHIVGGSSLNGAYKGADILHQALLELKVNSKYQDEIGKLWGKSWGSNGRFRGIAAETQ